MNLVGGVGTLLGPVIGAGVILTLQNELADRVGPWVTVIMGFIFVVCVLLFRRGIVGEIAARITSNEPQRRRERRESKSLSQRPLIESELTEDQRIWFSLRPLRLCGCFGLGCVR